MNLPANRATIHCFLCLALLACLTAATALQGQGINIFKQSGSGFGAGFGEPSGEQVTLESQFTSATIDRPAVLMITADIADGWHIYSHTQPAGGPQKTEITITPSDQFKMLGPFAATPEPKSHIDNEIWDGLEIQEHYDSVTWFAPIELAEGVSAETLQIEGQVNLQVCQGVCVPLSLDFSAEQGEGVKIGPLVFSSQAETPVTTDPIPAQAIQAAPTTPLPQELIQGPEYDLSAIQFADNTAESSLVRNLMLAFLGGLVLNLMPCVLPVIGLKVMSFVQQAGHSRRRALTLNLWYSLGIVSVFWALALLAITAGFSWGEQFGSPAFNVVMTSIVFVMALSLLGVWEIPIPGFFGSGSAMEAAEQEGPLGAFLKGVVTTVLATPCTGPGMAVALGWAVRQAAPTTFLTFTVLGAGMAFPYLLIGAFPSLVRFLPKPGQWMVTFKQLMGFVLIGTVIYLLSVLPTHYLLPTLSLLTALALACWIYANTPITADFSVRSQTWALCGAIIAAGAVFSFAWLMPLLVDDGSGDAWQPFSLTKLQQIAVEDGKTVMVDFGADWCANCKVLEKTVLHTEPVDNAIKKAGVVTMFADNTNYPPEIKKTLSALNSNGVPVIAIFPGSAPHNPIVFRGIYTQDQLVEAINQATSEKASGVATAQSNAGGGLN